MAKRNFLVLFFSLILCYTMHMTAFAANALEGGVTGKKEEKVSQLGIELVDGTVAKSDYANGKETIVFRSSAEALVAARNDANEALDEQIEEAETAVEEATQKAADKEESEQAAQEERLIEAARKAEEERLAAIEAKKKEIEEKRQSICDYACQFIGNPYVWGGSSLTNGCDCSHFVWLVLQDTIGFDQGYHVACEWINLGTAVDSYEDAKPGDVIVWDHHVALYIGNNQIVEAKGENYGIVKSDMSSPSSYTSGFMGIRRFVLDED